VLTLLVLQGPDKGRRFELPDAPAIVGRDSRQIPLTDQTVSRRHAELLPMEDEWILKDLGSVNGSYLNGMRVDNRKPLKLGDQIRVGRTLMVFGAQPGISRTSSRDVNLAGEEQGMDSAIMHTVASNEDSMVLAVPEPAVAAMANLKILYQLGAALGSSFDVDHVLEVVMDLVFEHVKADRGILLLIDERTGELTPKVVRTRDETEPQADRGPAGRKLRRRPGDPVIPSAAIAQSAPAKPVATNGSGGNQIHASRTIINYVISNGEGVLSSNAMTDRRFSKGKSVHNMGIRSALCVPIKARKFPDKPGDDIIGVIYIDSSVKNYTYAPDQLRLLTAIGLQAGLAMQNTKLYQQGLQAERLAAVGETTAALSHSIKNILQALRGGADVVELGFKSNNIVQAGKGWRVVDRNLTKIFDLTMNLLAYSKPREPAMEIVQPRKLIEECLELVAAGANAKGVMAVSDCDRDVPPVPLDSAGIHQVLMNLLSNALDAVEQSKGLIRVTCRYVEATSELVIEVTDNGIGIPPGMMKHMFELFHSTKGNRGTGLGLAVARKIVEEHDGTIAVKSVEKEGSTFTVRIPVYAHAADDPSQTHAPSQRR
jgi:signal transduction histidine kinase/pSer/pThr/pTyr-binding forkhead associated (FHA) protein